MVKDEIKSTEGMRSPLPLFRGSREGPESGGVEAGCAAEQEDISVGDFVLEAAVNSRTPLVIISEDED